MLFSLCSPWLGFVFSYINYDGFCSACQQPASSTVLLHWRSPGHLARCSRLWPGGCPQLELHHLTLREEQEPPSPSWLLPARVLQQEVVFRLLIRGGTSSTLQLGPKAHTPLTYLSNPERWVAAKKCKQNQTRHQNAAVPGVRQHQEAAFPIPPLGRIHRLSQWKCCRDVINDCGLSSVSSTLHY